MDGTMADNLVDALVARMDGTMVEYYAVERVVMMVALRDAMTAAWSADVRDVMKDARKENSKAVYSAVQMDAWRVGNWVDAMAVQ